MNDEALQKSLARLMLAGVVLSAILIFAGLVMYLMVRGAEPMGDKVFTGEPSYFREPMAAFSRSLEEGQIGQRRSVIQLGILLLLLNPVVRVAFAAVGFAAQRDVLYAVVSAAVLAVLGLSFFW